MIEKDVLYNNRYSLGSNGDILATKDSPFNEPLLDTIVSFFWGGHSVITKDGGNKLIDVIGNSLDKTDYVDIRDNSWLVNRNHIIGLRVVDAELEDYNKTILNAENKIKMPYNMLFVINNTNAYYCTDFVKVSWKETGFVIDYDGFVTSVNDLVLSKNTYIYFYKYTDKNGIEHIYYLD